MDEYVPSSIRPGRDDLYKQIVSKINNKNYKGGFGTIRNRDGSVSLQSESGGERMIKDLFGSHTEDMKDEEIVQLFEDLYAPMRKDLHEEGADPKKIQAAEIQFDKGMKKRKNIYYNQLKRVEATYGTLPTQMHPQDFFKQVGPEFKEQTINQDWGVFIKFGQKYLDENDPEEGEKNKEFKRLADYYQKASLAFPMYGMLEKDPSLVDKGGYEKTLYEESRLGPETEVGIGGPKMNPKQLARYNADLKKRAEKEGWSHKLYGRYLNPPDLSESEEGSESEEDDLLKEERSSLLNENAEESPNIMDTAFNYGHKKKKRRH